MDLGASYIAVIARAHAAEPDDQHWLQGIADAVHELLPTDLGAGGFAYEIEGGQVRLRDHVAAGVDAAARAAVVSTMERLGSHATVLLKIPRVTQWSEFAPAHGGTAATQQIAATSARLGLADAIGLGGHASQTCGVNLGILSTRAISLRPTERAAWARVAAHLGAAYRWRRRVAELRRSRPEALGADAVLDLRGRVLHAEGPATAPEARATMAHATQSIEHALRVRRAQPEEAVELWQALWRGEWTLVAREERGQARHYVAYRNAHGATPGGNKLSPREEAVVSLLARGEPLKLVGYELGLSVSTVAGHAKRAMAKLGVRDRRELMRTFMPPGERG